MGQIIWVTWYNRKRFAKDKIRSRVFQLVINKIGIIIDNVFLHHLK